MRKLFLLLTLAGFFLLSFGDSAKATEKELPIRVITEGREPLRVTLLLVNGMGYLAVEDIGKIFAAEVSYSSDRQAVSLTVANKQIRLFANSKKAILDHQIKLMGKITRLVKGEIFVPLELLLTRDFGKVVNCYVDWSFQEKLLSVRPRYNIRKVYVLTSSSFTSLSVEFTQPLTADVSRPETDHLLIEIEGGNLDILGNTFSVQDGVIQNVVSAQKGTKVSIDINLGKLAGQHKVSRGEAPPCLRIEIARKGPPFPLTGLVPPTTATPLAIQRSSEPAKVIISHARKLQLKTIVIDPGHGGKDPGAIGCRGTKEKDLVLSIAKYLASYLRKELKVKVLLTRETDIFVPLSERVDFANKAKADLFISIHANAHLSPKKHGFEIYFLSEKASDAEAQAVANRENAALNLEAPKQQQTMLNRILWSMALNEYMNESSQLCALIAGRVEKQIKELTNRGVKQANFHVLRGTKMPAILVEAAFISNPIEEKFLKKSSFQKQMASTILAGIKEYRKYLEGSIEK